MGTTHASIKRGDGRKDERRQSNREGNPEHPPSLLMRKCKGQGWHPEGGVHHTTTRGDPPFQPRAALVVERRKLCDLMDPATWGREPEGRATEVAPVTGRVVSQTNTPPRRDTCPVRPSAPSEVMVAALLYHAIAVTAKYQSGKN